MYMVFQSASSKRSAPAHPSPIRNKDADAHDEDHRKRDDESQSDNAD
jgi:hypothetical protein